MTGASEAASQSPLLPAYDMNTALSDQLRTAEVQHK